MVGVKYSLFEPWNLWECNQMPQTPSTRGHKALNRGASFFGGECWCDSPAWDSGLEEPLTSP